jgi:L-fucose isomerase-like protein
MKEVLKMSDKKIRLGVLPIKRSFLSLKVANEEKVKMYDAIKRIKPEITEIIDIDDVCDSGILYREEEVDRVVKKFREHEVDAIFLCHCDFGEESVALHVIKKFQVPVLLWGNRDKYTNTFTTRGRDTQCGMFACSKVLLRNNIKFSYIYNVDVFSDEFSIGYENFLRTVNVIKTVKSIKIAQIGNRPQPFISVVANEGELMEKFGIETVPISVTEIIRKTKELIEDNDKLLQEWTDKALLKFDCTSENPEKIRMIQALAITIKAMMEEKGCTAGALECWSLFPKEIGIAPCMVISALGDMGIPLSCEMDLNGALTMAVAKAVALNEEAVFLADLTIRHPQNDNAELLWHCGPFPSVLCNKAQKPKIVNAQGSWELQKGNITILRCDEISGKYQMIAAEGNAVDGPETTGTYVWLEVDNWKRLEEKFIFGPYIHHVAGVYGNYTRALKEVSKYLNIQWDSKLEGLESLS